MIKRWILRWLGAVTFNQFNSRFATDAEIIASHLYEFNEKLQALKLQHEQEIADLKAEHNDQMAELIGEVNKLRNAIPPVLMQEPRPTVRVLRNWRDVRAAMEVKVERKS